MPVWTCSFSMRPTAFTYDAEREALCKVLEQMRAEGRRVPQIAMFAVCAAQCGGPARSGRRFTSPASIVLDVVSVERQAAPTDTAAGLSEEVKAFFTIRTSWAWTRGQPGLAMAATSGRGSTHAPQVPGWHESPDKAECVPVGVSQHITSNIGRSFHGSRQPAASGVPLGARTLL
jgi:hypothetical protein